MKTDRKNIETFFNHFSPHYDVSIQKFQYNGPEWLDERLTQLEIRDPQTILDLGCGTGLIGRKFRKHLPKSRIIGVDISTGMIQRAGQNKIYDQLVWQDLETELPLGLRTDLINDLSIISCIAVTDYITDLEVFMQRLRALAKSGAQLFISFQVSESFLVKNYDVGFEDFVSIGQNYQYVQDLLKRNSFKLQTEKVVTGYTALDRPVCYAYFHAQFN